MILKRANPAQVERARQLLAHEGAAGSGDRGATMGPRLRPAWPTIEAMARRETNQ
jgi:hypothetical protein